MLRCAIVPPVPVPYREPLFQRLAARPDLLVRVIYQAARQPSWDQASGWFPASHGYDAVTLEPRQIARAGRSPITWPKGLERALSRFSPEVVVVSEFGPATLRVLAWCKAKRRAIVVLSEVTVEVAGTLPAPQRRLHRFLAGHVDGLIAVSTRARERLLALGVAPERAMVSMQPVDEAALIAAAYGEHADRGCEHADRGCEHADRGGRRAYAAIGREAAQSGPVEVLAVARLVPDKDIGVLLEAFAAAGLGEGQARLAIVGGGPQEEELKRQARALRVPAHFFGSLPASELPGRYAAAHVFALPSRHEPFGVALREAVVAGLPVVCSSAVGAAGDLAHEGVNAFVTAPGDVDGLAQALRRLCQDAQLRIRMGEASREVARAHPLEADVEAFATMVSQAAQAARARR